jgi:hypothetical protein
MRNDPVRLVLVLVGLALLFGLGYVVGGWLFRVVA